MRIEDFYRGLPVLVTGATGFIGSHLAERLVAMGARVRCLVRRTSRLDRLPQGVELACGDLATGEGLADALREVALVFHLAGVTKALSPSEYVRGNVLATRNLVLALERSSARLVHVSSLAAVGPSPDGTPVREDVEPRPVSLYGRSKLEAERAVLDSSVVSRAVILRPPVVFGPRDEDVYQLFRMAAKGLILVVGNPRTRFSVIFVHDLVDGLLAAGASHAGQGRTFFLAAEEGLSWRGLADLAGKALGRSVRILRAPLAAAWLCAASAEIAGRMRGKPAIISRDKLREARAGEWLCDPRRARLELGFVAGTPHDRAIAATLG
ncbi:MAG: NAD-dependent epimerase/dehydratase family protein, partial [Bryobacteraceae bacterium]|nr:NAD-dependent epimerase/dehydratase family protein [Bryobacteraceae bacterium]